MAKKLTLLEQKILNELAGIELQAFIYTRDNCSYCARAKSIMDSNGIKYYEANISRSQSDLDTFNRVFGPSATKPQIYIARVPQDQEVQSDQWEFIEGGCSGFEQWIANNITPLEEAKTAQEFYLYTKSGCSNCQDANQ